VPSAGACASKPGFDSAAILAHWGWLEPEIGALRDAHVIWGIQTQPVVRWLD